MLRCDPNSFSLSLGSSRSLARPAAVPRGAASKYDRRRSTSSWVFSLLFGEATLFALFLWTTAAVGLTQVGDTGKREMVKVVLLITDYEHPATRLGVEIAIETPSMLVTTKGLNRSALKSSSSPSFMFALLRQSLPGLALRLD